ncbi:MAG: excinuclease ABC subunit B [Candidatus Omnitrophota bacterium]|nr:MAG: excinuclease ABC subunit B [Candidatus Omnitrophota bacterium]
MDFKLVADFSPAGDQPKAIRELIKGYKKGARFMTLLGVTGSGKTFTIANVIEKVNKPVLVISPNKILAAQLYREYKSFFPHNKVCYFVSYYDYYQPEAYLPSTDTYIAKEAVINEEIEALRHLATSSLMERRDTIVIASVSCIYNLGLPTNYFERAIYLEKNKVITRGDLVKHLVRIQYERNDLELKKGRFRARGEVIEVMPPSEDVIYRIDLTDQRVRSLSVIDRLRREKIEDVEQLIIFPAKHFIVWENELERAMRDIEDELRERIRYFHKEGRFLEAERLQRRTKTDMAMIRALGYCHGIENYSRHLLGKLPGEPPETLLSYFPQGKGGKPDFLTIIDESHITLPQIKAMYEGDRKRKEMLIEYGWRLPSALDNRPLRFDEFLKRVDQVIFTSATPGEFEKANSEMIVEQIIRPTYLLDPEVRVKPVYDKKKEVSQIDDLLKEVERIIERKERILVNTLTKRIAEELTEFLNSKGFPARYMHSETKTLERAEILTAFRKGEFSILVGVNLLREGLDLPEVSLVAILDADREGFLRSETAFIQTMGRAARNVRGEIILYADNLTTSLRKAIEEVRRRRRIQLEYNRRYHKQPQTVRKEVRELIEREEMED